MSAGFFTPKGPTYDDTIVATWTDLKIYFDAVDQFDIDSDSENARKNEDRIKSIIEEDLGIHTEEYTDPNNPDTTLPADLNIRFEYEESEDRVKATITDIDSYEKYFLVARIIRMLYKNLYDEPNIYEIMMTQMDSFSDKLPLKATGRYNVSGSAFEMVFDISGLSGSPAGTSGLTYPIDEADSVYRNMIAHRIKATLGINILTGLYTTNWITFTFAGNDLTVSFAPENYSPTGTEPPSKEMMRRRAKAFITVLRSDNSTPSDLFNQYMFLQEACVGLTT